MSILDNITSYNDAVSYITSIPRFADKNDFIYMSAFYRFLGLEREDVKVFHVAGTNGKGSTCAYLASMHMAMGKKVGLFTSPHLVDIRERITISGAMVSEEEFFDAFVYVVNKYEEFIMDEVFASYRPTYFAWFFFVGAVCFYNAKVDAIIWECGLGGKLDATNTIVRKDVCVIAEVGLDHMEILGDTIEEIAGEKAGILKENVPVVFIGNRSEVSAVIRDAAKKCGAVIGREIKDVNVESRGDKRIDFSYNSRYYNNVMLILGSIARYQAENASLAVAAMEQVYGSDELDLDTIQEGLLNMKWPGRMEEIEPGIVFDGAHNVDGIKALLDTVSRCECNGKRYLLFSAVTDKQADIMLDMIYESKLFDEVGLAHIDNSRGIDTDALCRLAEGRDCTTVYSDVMSAYATLKGKLEGEDMLYVCGSLYLIAQLESEL